MLLKIYGHLFYGVHLYYIVGVKQFPIVFKATVLNMFLTRIVNTKPIPIIPKQILNLKRLTLNRKDVSPRYF